MEWGKLPLFLKKSFFFEENFNLQYLSQLISYWYQIETSKTKKWFLSRIFLFISYFENSTRYEIKGAETIFLRKKGLFSEFWGKCYITEFSSWISITEKNIKKIKIEKWIFGRFLFYLFFIFLFFSKKNFFILKKFEKVIPDSEGS